MVRAIGVAAEATSGTYTTPTYYFDPLSEGINLNENVIIPDTISTRAGRRAFLTHQDSSGSVEFLLDTTIASFFLSAVAGQSSTASGVTTVALVPTSSRKTLPSVSVAINSLYFMRKIAGAGVKRVTIKSSGGPGNLPTLEADFAGGSETKAVVDTDINVSSFSEEGKILANTTAWIYLADADAAISNKGATGLLKVKNFDISIEPIFKEDPIIGTDGLDPELYYPENWRVRVSLTIPMTPENTKWFTRYMGHSQDADADGIGGSVSRVWDLLNDATHSSSFPLQFRAYFEYSASYTLQIDVKNMVIVEPPSYNESGKTIADINLTLEALNYDDSGTDKTWQAVVKNDTNFTGSNLPGNV